MHKVIEWLDKLVTSLERILSKQDLIELWVIPDQGTSYMQKFTLSLEQDLKELEAVLSTSDVMIYAGDLEKLLHAGLAHLLYERVESDALYTPQQMEFAFMTLHKAEDVHETIR